MRDPNVRLPRGVKELVDQGERIYQQAYGQQLNEPAPSQDEQQQADPPAEQQQADAGPIRPPVQPPHEQTFTKPSLAETDEQQAAPQPPPPASWEQRYKTLEGRAKADATAHRKQLNEFSARIEEQTKALMEGSRVIAGMQDEIRQLRAAPPPPLAKPVKPAEIEFELTAEEREQWSPEFLNLVKRAAGAVVSAQLQSKDHEITGLRSELALLGKQVQDVGTSNQQTSLQTFLNNMSIALPDWATQNTDDDFLAWLDQADGFSGESRKKALDRAVEGRNVAAAVRIFQGYRAELEALNPTPPAKPNGTGSHQGGNGRVRLEDLAAPRSTRQQPQSQQEAPLPPSPAEIQRFTADVTKGKYKGRDAERRAFQERIDNLARASVRLAARGNPY